MKVRMTKTLRYNLHRFIAEQKHSKYLCVDLDLDWINLLLKFIYKMYLSRIDQQTQYDRYNTNDNSTSMRAITICI